MGKVYAKIRITNHYDLESAERGKIDAINVRSFETKGLVDTGANYLCLPEDIVEQLDLTIVREVTATYADGRKVKKKIAKGIQLLKHFVGLETEI